MRIHHIAMRTRDLPRLESFYVDVLGLAVSMRQGERSVWLKAGETMVMLERSDPGEPSVPSGSMEFLAFSVEPAERERHAIKLRAAGVSLEAETAFTMYFRDPDGRRVGLSHYPTET